MKRLAFLCSTIFILFSCQNETQQSTQKVGDPTLNGSKLPLEPLQSGEVEYSEINWNNYLNKENIEEFSNDSALLVVVKPDYALFVYAQLNQEETELACFDIIFFQKQQGKWIKTGTEQIADLQTSDYLKDKWLLQDINGDGHKDVLLKIYHDGKRNKQYVCYLQKPRKEAFVKLDWFSKVSNPEFDSEKKVLSTRSAYSKGMTEKTYRWVNDTLQLIKGERFGQVEEVFYTEDDIY
jgi:hypothetical protein